MKRRILALLMSLVMILSVLPVAALAEPADSSEVLTYADLAAVIGVNINAVIKYSR